MGASPDSNHENLTNSEQEENWITVCHEPNHTRTKHRRPLTKWRSVLPLTKTLSVSVSAHYCKLPVGVAELPKMDSSTEVAGEITAFRIGFVHTPFPREGSKYQQSVDKHIVELDKHSDTQLSMLNEKWMQPFDGKWYANNGVHSADEVLKNAIAGIIKMVATPCFVNVQFEDVCKILKNGELKRVGLGSASGVDRACISATQALTSILPEIRSPFLPKGMIVNITAAKTGLKMEEINAVMNTVKAICAKDTSITFGVVLDESMQDAMRVTLVACSI